MRETDYYRDPIDEFDYLTPIEQFKAGIITAEELEEIFKKEIYKDDRFNENEKLRFKKEYSLAIKLAHINKYTK